MNYMKKTSFKVFNRMLKIKNVKLENKVNLFNRIIEYIRFRLKIAFMKLLAHAFLTFTIGLSDKLVEEKRFKKNYRKVIKKGLLWDTVEYHER